MVLCGIIGFGVGNYYNGEIIITVAMFVIMK